VRACDVFGKCDENVKVVSVTPKDIPEVPLAFETYRSTGTGSGLQMLDGGEADDKIIAVLRNDYIWNSVKEIDDLPDVLVQRLKHYFSTYKMSDELDSSVSITGIYGRTHAARVIDASLADYEETFGPLRRAVKRAEDEMLHSEPENDLS
jgi:hypothetical protein